MLMIATTAVSVMEILPGIELVKLTLTEPAIVLATVMEIEG
jgi:hypothetical protein